MNINLPDPGTAALRDAFAAIKRAFNLTATTQAPVECVLLLAPDKSAWRVAVDNAGALTATKVQG